MDDASAYIQFAIGILTLLGMIVGATLFAAKLLARIDRISRELTDLTKETKTHNTTMSKKFDEIEVRVGNLEHQIGVGS